MTDGPTSGVDAAGLVARPIGYITATALKGLLEAPDEARSVTILRNALGPNELPRVALYPASALATPAPAPALPESGVEAVRAVADLIDKLAKCRSENAMDEAFLDNPEEIAAAVIAKLRPTPLSWQECEWPAERFTVHDFGGEHDPCYVVMPDGAMIPFNHHPGKNGAGDFVDVARARFVAAACNAALATPAPAPALPESGVEGVLPMSAAPKNATWVRLLIDYSTHDATCQMEDDSGPQWTIGFNNDDNTGENEGWKFVGWDWQHDCIVGTSAGTPIGWLPFPTLATPALPPPPAPVDAHGFEDDGWGMDDEGRFYRTRPGGGGII